jgi:electron transport complex protein RnfG
MKRIINLAVILMVFCVISAGGLAYVYLFTQPQIDKNAKLSLENSLREVLPGSGDFEEIKCEDAQAYKSDKGLAVLVSPRGYSGPIKMLVGVDRQGKVVRVKVLDQRETPGLGANVVKPGFLSQFSGKSISDKLEPKQDIDAITGATITSRAACQGVKQALKCQRKLR